ncbi:MAG: M16 family metallopeptidase [Candidatus Methylomirabilia bacterium]
MRRFAWLLVVILLIASPVEGGPLNAHREVLPNGIVVLIAERPAIPIVAVRAYVRAGSAFDPPDAPGLANLTAELLTRGTARRLGPELDEAIEFVGGSLGADAGRDGVTVSLSVLKKDLMLGLDLLAEVLREPLFPEEELTRKVKEIQAGIRASEEDPARVAVRELAGLVYRSHPYGHPVAGTEEAVGKLTRDQVVEFYRRHYRPDATILVIVGDVRRQEIIRELVSRFGRWTAPGRTPSIVLPAPSAPAVQAHRIARELKQATVYLGRPAIPFDHPDYYPLRVASYILGGGSASRLYTTVRGKAGLAYSVWSYLSVGRYGAGLFVGLQTRIDGVSEALRLVEEELVRMGKERVSDSELALTKAYLTGSFPLRIDTSAKLAGLLVTVEELGLGLDYPERFQKRVEAVTTADVQRVAKRYLDPSTLSRVTVGTPAAGKRR